MHVWFNLLLTPAPVSGGSACGGGGECLWLAVLFSFAGAFCRLGEGIKVSGGGGSVRACVLVVAIVCACMCVRARAWW